MIVRRLASLLAVASSTVQVAQPAYWDELYAESLRMNVTDFHHSWQGVNFEKLAQVLGNRLQLREDLVVLVLGSGDSLLPEEIHQKGVTEVIAMDLSPRLSQARSGVRSLMEDARSQTSLEASSVDVIIELGLLDVILAEADVEGAAALLREARRLLCAGGLFISGSTDIPKFRQPLLAEHPAGGWANAEVLRLDRPLALDRRVKELDPSWEVDRIFIYLNLAAGEVEVGQALRPSGTEAATAAPLPTAEAEASPEPAASQAPPVEAAAPSPEAAAPPALPVEAAAPSPEAAPPPAPPVEAAAPSPEAAAPPAPPVEAAAPSPEAAPPPAPPVEAAAPSPEAAAPPAPPVEAAAPPAAPEAAVPAPSLKSPVEDPAEAFAESIRRLQAQAAALAKS